jgi:arylsulfatase A-like enzyme
MGYDALRADGWKFIRYRELEGADELYDLKADPYEMNNRVADRAAQATLGELRKRLDAAVDAAR